MAAISALYYPSIEIHDLAWMKTSVLYWNDVRTIVPASMDQPYASGDLQRLAEVEALRPRRVESMDEAVGEASRMAAAWLASDKGRALLKEDAGSGGHAWGGADFRDRIHMEKMAFGFAEALAEAFGEHPGEHTPWLNLPKGVVASYMAMLAGRIADRDRLVPLTDRELPHEACAAARRGTVPELFKSEASAGLVEGVLVKASLETVHVPAETPVERLVEFRERNRGEVGRLRSVIGQLVAGMPADLTLTQAEQWARETYENEVLPEIVALRERLEDLRIGFAGGTVSTVFGLTVVEGALPVALLGLSGPHALLAMAGVSVIGAAVRYHTSRREALRSNPYSYVLALEREYGN